MINDRRDDSRDLLGAFYFALCMALFAFTYAQAVIAMVVKGEDVAATANKNRSLEEKILGKPGTIFDRNGLPLSMNEVVYTADFNPLHFQIWAQNHRDKADGVLLAMADAFGKNRTQLRKAARSEKKYYVLQKKLVWDKVRDLKKKRFPTVNFVGAYKAFFPGREETAHVLGYINDDGKNGEGVVFAMDRRLRPSNGVRMVYRSGEGRTIRSTNKMPATDGKDITLSIDTRLQFLAIEALQRSVDKVHKAKTGSAVLLDIANGDILAMASYPSFNPNNIDKRAGNRKNQVIKSIYEPGSTMKPFIVALALEEGVVLPSTVLPTTKPLENMRPTKDWDLTVQEIIKHSENTGMILISQMLDDKRMEDGLRRFGFGAGEKLLGLEGEVAGELPSHQDWKGTDKGRLSFGYGMTATLLEVARAYTVFARGGTLPGVRLYLDKPPTAPVRVISTRTAASMLVMLESVIADGGTGALAQIPGYRIAGKTGTTQVHKKLGGYHKDRYRSWFVGFAPASAPRFVCAVMVDEPSAGDYYGGKVAAPVCQELLIEALRRYKAPFDDPHVLSGMTGPAKL